MKKLNFDLNKLLRKTKPEAFLATSFLAMILIGTILLTLPFSTISGITFIDAFFTSTSATCVTGLVVVDTGTTFTLFGQAVILILMQFGGIGIMTFAALAFHILGIRLSLRAQEATSSSIIQNNFASEFKPILFRIISLIMIIELIGAVLLFIGFLPKADPQSAIWSAVFHSVSAFCNAGFSLYSDSLIGFRDNPIIIATIIFLIIIGGIGFPVLDDIGRFIKNKTSKSYKINRISLHSKVVILTSLGLIIIGTIFLFVFSFNSDYGIFQRISISFFQSVTARTAGFNTIEIGNLPSVSILILIVLMFIGGSPGSCAGGIKTTTFSLWISQMWSRLHEGYGTNVFGRYIPQEITRRVSTIIGISIWWNIIGTFILLATQHLSSTMSFEDIFFEQISAFGTVGLSTGITSSLNLLGKLWIIITMYIGRIGPLTIIVLMLRKKTTIRYPEGRIMVG